ncbi:flavodoxin family protein [Methanogenium sp. S4BF]|uniref:flavodoxin family protein n=1 Tax=Methanogenium sp. S4BF TaxID=1789226 RepID=UPI00241609D0|nr:flavodoxin family protein [Methanogenium sp. S4BF]WFN35608.1 flavodoxin family protein [Methanogenium sp. S4BF]
MKCAAVFGSPRDGNSDVLAEEFLLEAERLGAVVERYSLRTMKFTGCIGCMACKDGRAEACILDDDLTPVLASIAAADIVLLATPVYFRDVSWLLKACLDRWYGFFGYTEGECDLRIPAGKKMVFVVTQNMPREYLNDMMRKYNTTFMQLGFDKMYPVRGCEVGDEPDAVLGRDDLLVLARETAAVVMAGRVSPADLPVYHFG